MNKRVTDPCEISDVISALMMFGLNALLRTERYAPSARLQKVQLAL